MRSESNRRTTLRVNPMASLTALPVRQADRSALVVVGLDPAFRDAIDSLIAVRTREGGAPPVG
jgi:hypothetical protein